MLLDRIPDLAPALDNAIKLEGLEKRPQDRTQQIRDFLKHLASEKATPVPYKYPAGLNGKQIRDVYLHAIDIKDGKLAMTFKAEPLAK
jgi:hypothetical protein